MVRVAILGTGIIAAQNHIPGIRMHPKGEVVALCDPDPQALAKAAAMSGVSRTYADSAELFAQEDVDAVVIATPNYVHRELVLAAAQAKKHVLCEKPLAMSHAEAEAMVAAATGAGIVHMTAFTYRFVPAVRYMKRLIAKGALGTPYHVRINRLQDWGDRAVGWRQKRALAGTGEIGDMLSHRIDYAHYLVGPVVRLVAQTKRILAERRRPDGSTDASDVEDWVAFLGELEGGATGVFESTKMATGRGSGGQSQDYVEINGSDATFVYYLDRPFEILIGKPGGRLETEAVPDELLKVPGSPRDPREGDPIQGFRYDQAFEFVQAIVEQRPASPDFGDGARVQAVIDAILRSAELRQWVDVPGGRVA